MKCNLIYQVKHKDGQEVKTETKVEVAPIQSGGDMVYAETNKEVTSANKNQTFRANLSAYTINVWNNFYCCLQGQLCDDLFCV